MPELGILSNLHSIAEEPHTFIAHRIFLQQLRVVIWSRVTWLGLILIPSKVSNVLLARDFRATYTYSRKLYPILLDCRV